jgi:glucose-1-phosphate cytidylyltransferase
MSTTVTKAVILAGGLGTRFAEETSTKPKPLIEIGGLPILWHIMKIYYAQGIREFVICLGYKGYLVKEFFSNYHNHVSDFTIDFSDNVTTFHRKRAEDWKVTLIDTGADTMTGGRIKRIQPYVGDETFCMTYGDGVADIDIGALLDHHNQSGRDATMTVVTPPGRFGATDIEGDRIVGFREKPLGDGGLINGGFFVLSPKVFDFIEGDTTIFERAPLEALAAKGMLSAYRHSGFWQPMDTLRDQRDLQNRWDSQNAPWCVWKEETT